MIFTGDFHVHTYFSDGCIDLHFLINTAAKSGFNFISKADHNTDKGNKALEQLARKNNFIYIPCVEISAKSAHIMAINCKNYDPKWTGMEIDELLDRLNENNIFSVYCHPYWRSKVNLIHKYSRFNGIEILNQTSPFGSLKMLKEMTKFKNIYARYACISSSDSHSGNTYGKFINKIYASDHSDTGLMEALYKNQVEIVHTPFIDTIWYSIEDGKNIAVNKFRQKNYKYIKDMITTTYTTIDFDQHPNV